LQGANVTWCMKRVFGTSSTICIIPNHLHAVYKSWTLSGIVLKLVLWTLNISMFNPRIVAPNFHFDE
jgi:hypothetical protein